VSFDAATRILRSWLGQPVTVEIEPDGTVMEGVLAEREDSGDPAYFTVDPDDTTGVAVALFGDGVRSAVLDGETLRIEQGRMTLTVTCGGRRSARD
jgi:hypothetical protein